MRTKHSFNLIEISIALGVIAIGLVAVVGAFPLAANKTRDAMTETYAAESAEQMLAFIENYLRHDFNGDGENNDNWPTTDTAPSGFPTSNTTPAYDLGGTAQPGTRESVWDCGSGVYRIIRYVDKTGGAAVADQYDGGTDILDFEAMVAVWVEKVNYDGTNDIPYTMAVRLNVEVSWPAVADYDNRQKAYYTTELFKR